MVIKNRLSTYHAIMLLLCITSSLELVAGPHHLRQTASRPATATRAAQSNRAARPMNNQNHTRTNRTAFTATQSALAHNNQRVVFNRAAVKPILSHITPVVQKPQPVVAAPVQAPAPVVVQKTEEKKEAKAEPAPAEDKQKTVIEVPSDKNEVKNEQPVEPVKEVKKRRPPLNNKKEKVQKAVAPDDYEEDEQGFDAERKNEKKQKIVIGEVPKVNLLKDALQKNSRRKKSTVNNESFVETSKSKKIPNVFLREMQPTKQFETTEIVGVPFEQAQVPKQTQVVQLVQPPVQPVQLVQPTVTEPVAMKLDDKLGKWGKAPQSLWKKVPTVAPKQTVEKPELVTGVKNLKDDQLSPKPEEVEKTEEKTEGDELPPSSEEIENNDDLVAAGTTAGGVLSGLAQLPGVLVSDAYTAVKGGFTMAKAGLGWVWNGVSWNWSHGVFESELVEKNRALCPAVVDACNKEHGAIEFAVGKVLGEHKEKGVENTTVSNCAKIITHAMVLILPTLAAAYFGTEAPVKGFLAHMASVLTLGLLSNQPLAKVLVESGIGSAVGSTAHLVGVPHAPSTWLGDSTLTGLGKLWDLTVKTINGVNYVARQGGYLTMAKNAWYGVAKWTRAQFGAETPLDIVENAGQACLDGAKKIVGGAKAIVGDGVAAVGNAIGPDVSKSYPAFLNQWT